MNYEIIKLENPVKYLCRGLEAIFLSVFEKSIKDLVVSASPRTGTNFVLENPVKSSFLAFIYYVRNVKHAANLR